ncbi:hypothetical protein [Ornithinimicrobium sp. W1665]
MPVGHDRQHPVARNRRRSGASTRELIALLTSELSGAGEGAR